MSVDVKALVASTPGAAALLKVVLATPYIERQALEEAVKNVPTEQIEKALAVLKEKMVVLELASQADSSVESRVPKKIYLVNPELDNAIRAAI